MARNLSWRIKATWLFLELYRHKNTARNCDLQLRTESITPRDSCTVAGSSSVCSVPPFITRALSKRSEDQIPQLPASFSHRLRYSQKADPHIIREAWTVSIFVLFPGLPTRGIKSTLSKWRQHNLTPNTERYLFQNPVQWVNKEFHSFNRGHVQDDRARLGQRASLPVPVSAGNVSTSDPSLNRYASNSLCTKAMSKHVCREHFPIQSLYRLLRTCHSER